MIAISLIHEHLLINSIDQSYTHWSFHGESLETTNGKPSISKSGDQHDDMYPRMEEIVKDAFGKIGEYADALMDNLIRNGDSNDNPPKFQGHEDHEARKYKS